MSHYYKIQDKSGTFYTCPHWPDERYCSDCLVQRLDEFHVIKSSLRKALDALEKYGGHTGGACYMNPPNHCVCGLEKIGAELRKVV